MFIAGCSNIVVNKEEYIVVQKRFGDDHTYDDFRKITDREQVQKVKEIIKDINWVKAQVSMIRPADYRFAFQDENSIVEIKSALYELWISPDKDKVEVVIDAESKYIQLDKNTSAELVKILTDEKISHL